MPAEGNESPHAPSPSSPRLGVCSLASTGRVARLTGQTSAARFLFLTASCSDKRSARESAEANDVGVLHSSPPVYCLEIYCLETVSEENRERWCPAILGTASHPANDQRIMSVFRPVQRPAALASRQCLTCSSHTRRLGGLLVVSRSIAGQTRGRSLLIPMRRGSLRFS